MITMVPQFGSDRDTIKRIMSKLPSGDITTATFIRFWLVMVGFLGSLLILYLTRDALILVAISIFLALALNPPVTAIANKLPGNSRVGATAIAYVIVVAALGLFIITVIPTVAEQFAKFVKTLPGLLQTFTDQSHWISDIIERYSLQGQVNDTLAGFQRQAGDIAQNIGGSFINSIGSLVQVFISGLLVLVMTFLMLIEGPAWTKRAWSLYKNKRKREHHHELVSKMYRVVTGYVNGQVFISAISSVCSLVVVIILGAVFDIPGNLAVPIAVIVFITGLIPMFGATIGAIIAGLLLATNDIGAAIIFLIYFFVYQQVENNFISPVVQSKSVEISALTVLVALTIGLSMFGLLGGLISIPVAGCIRVLVLDYLERHKAKQSTANAK